MKFTNKTKLLALLMALMLMITAVFVGCGSEDKKDDDKKDETTVAEEKTTKADKDEDKNEDENDKPSIKGFTLQELKAALNEYAKNQDLDQLKSYILPESDAILEYMLANDSSADDAKFIEEEGLEAYSSITERFSDSPMIPLNTHVSDVYVDFANDGAHYFGDQGNEVLYENALDYYVETYAPNYYDVAAEAVAKAYGEKVEFVGLSFIEFSVFYDVENGQWFELFIIETNTGWFFLTETL